MGKRKKSVVPGDLFPDRYSFRVRSNYFTAHDSFASIGEDLAQCLTQVLLLVSEVVMLGGSAASSVLFSLAAIATFLSKAVTPLLHIGLTLCHLLWLMVQSIIILLKYRKAPKWLVPNVPPVREPCLTVTSTRHPWVHLFLHFHTTGTAVGCPPDMPLLTGELLPK
ncbi:hypothetical protein XELAEV_18002500mg [Xenopus laevis]|nr:hypothetical protein XELAEV_18002500mg [Xenopus laevis]